MCRKTALIKGASRGIGRGCAVALAEAGADIAVNYRVREEAARETCSLIERMGKRATLIIFEDGNIRAHQLYLVLKVNLCGSAGFPVFPTCPLRARSFWPFEIMPNPGYRNEFPPFSAIFMQYSRGLLSGSPNKDACILKLLHPITLPLGFAPNAIYAVYNLDELRIFSLETRL
jgi:hypothetical protein